MSMNTAKFCLLVLFSTWLGLLHAQFIPLEAPLRIHERVLANPWAGGANAPQFSSVDLNQDGRMDLHVFDREGNVQSTFLAVETAGTRHYVYAPEFVSGFPPVENWMLLRDYNGDQVVDIFAYSDIQGVDGMVIYTGKYSAGKLLFERKNFPGPFGLVSFPLNGSVRTPIYISKVDYPAVDDVDCDGDLDILTFNLAGGYAELFQNQSVEKGYRRDSLEFTLQNNCWGGFYESGITEALDLATAPGTCYRSGLEDLAVVYRHAGSTLLTVDIDADGDRDLLLGDVSYNNMSLLTNGGNCKTSWMNKQDNHFPSTSTPVDLPIFPAAYIIDANLDGKADIVVSPSARFGSETQNVAWLYSNTGTTMNPRYELQKKDFLVGDMLDLGTGANPVFADVNADGLMDLVVGNQTLSDPSGAKEARLFLFLNTGTSVQPQFVLQSDDWLGLSALGGSYFGFTPAFGDLDLDGDADLVVGDESGRLLYLQNQGGPGKPMDFPGVLVNWFSIDIGLASTPQIVDADLDGLPDLIVGERSGNLNFFKNLGTKGAPQFSSTPTDAYWGAVDTRMAGYTTGYSAPAVFYADGKWRIAVGTEEKGILLYTITPGNNTFSSASTPMQRTSVGFNSRPALADLNGDGLLDMAIGNSRGGIQLVKTPWISGTSTGLREFRYATPLACYPNPAGSEVQVRIPDEWSALSFRAELVDMQGRILRTWNEEQGNQTFPLEGIAPGWYILRLQSSKGVLQGKIAKL